MGLSSLFRKEATLNAILYILQQLGGKSDMHKIFKTLYFADQSHLSKYGRSITGDVYIAMQYGPVPSKTDDIFKAVRGDSYFHDDELNTYIHFVNKYIVEGIKKADLDYLSESDIECLDEAISKCKDKSFDELTKMSHGLAWENTRRDRAMSFKDILREEGDSEEYADYIADKLMLESSYR
jgi:uncharacterized phage-associated protein